ncbi:ribonuclease III [Marseillevirus Shanghai 1]|uniref:conserved putative ribonucleaseIII n=1 Tax=Melbournevirus TaxID=1560514 RepID=UPI00051F5748|nr:conserved putative ribonucleaseIII [Melbournevirus]AIT54832.1 ribonuclease III [Melbournevirus]AVR52958.1 ribonuclease III [Marseillevirus Shanghai 1]
MSEFAEFVDKVLILAGIGPKNRKKMTSEKNLAKFRVAFTHKTVQTNDRNNYELYELVGDSLVNAAILGFIRTKRPEITDVETLTRIKHYIQSRSFLSLLAFQNGYFEHVTVGEEFAKTILEGVEKRGRRHDREQRVMSKETRQKITELGEDALQNKTFSKLMTDLYEAMCGVIASLTEEMTKVPGMGYIPVYQLTSNFLERSDIELTYENIVDPITRLKETYQKVRYTTETGEKKIWNLSELEETERLPDGKFKVTIYGWFGKTKNPAIEKKQVLAFGISKDAKDAKMQAAAKGLSALPKYGLYEQKKLIRQ